MTTKKGFIAYITNESRRKASFNKRKKGLIKKVRELSTLCGLEACAIVYRSNEPEPEVLPSQLGRMLLRILHTQINASARIAKVIKSKLEDELYRLRKENKHKELEHFMYQCITRN
ncbi:hypothetical protein ACJIZ3_019702 [Penstemon smallii]|uniref:MADS-box domain-containing protein n=1 Tax=Penstemon smallii TaxID=265156 RepID=A0ABD3T1Z0_9LAMI